MLATVTLDNRKLAWFFIRIEGARGSSVYRGCVDTGACFCVLSPIDCQNLGLVRKDREKMRLITVKGETTAPVFTATAMEIMGTDLKAENVDVVAKKVVGFPLIIGMTFLENFNWSYNKAKNEFIIEK